MIKLHSEPLILQSASLNYLKFAPRRTSNRRFLVFCAFLLTLLFGCAFSFNANTPTFNTQVAFIGHRFISGRVEQLRGKTFDVDHLPAAGQLLTRINETSEEALHCNRTHYRTDVCVAQGDVRVMGGGEHGSGSFHVVVLVDTGLERVERVKPYTRKWEVNVMATIDEVKIIKKVINSSSPDKEGIIDVRIAGGNSFEEGVESAGAGAGNRSANLEVQKGHEAASDIHPQIKRAKGHKIRKRRRQPPPKISGRDDNELFMPELNSKVEKQGKAVPICEVHHQVPAILFSTGGYTGNVYHEFNDGLIPLFITAQQYAPPAGQVVLLVLEYHAWWMIKYKEVVAQISNYTVVDLSRDSRVHCFPEVTVGLRIHDELSIKAGRDDASMERFQAMLRTAYRNSLPAVSSSTALSTAPKLVIISRKGRSRVLLNEKEVVGLARKVGLEVQVLRPIPSTRMADIYAALSGCDVMLGVHGAALTHLLFMRPGTTFIQVVPLGTDWAAATYYGEPARKLGLKYVEYKVRPQESSLWQHYANDDPVLVDPESVNRRGGWWETKRIYLQAQNVTVSLPAMAALLRAATTAATSS
ncbi:hypothetical protein GOP47_0026260 [Adiantum capillus-veneris]|nr:hypothetical protein GOP47_0026260 [Adiantum capillus-veneris]